MTVMNKTIFTLAFALITICAAGQEYEWKHV